MRKPFVFICLLFVCLFSNKANAQTAIDSTTNYAWFSTVSGSNLLENWGWGSAFLVNGIKTSESNALGYSTWSPDSLSVNHQEWVTVELAAPHNLNKVILYPRSDAGKQGFGFPIDFKIQVSTDKLSWTTVATCTNYPAPSASAQTFKFGTQKAQYVRLFATKLSNKEANYVMQLAELEVYGVDTVKVDPNAKKWAGQWIWQSVDGSANTWTCFRKTINLTSVPSKVVASIAADSKYWLWVNGNMVVFEGGLKRGPNQSDSYYDEVDISSFLKVGGNAIAIQVWYFGKEGFSHKSSGKGGLYFESVVNNDTIKSDRSWKMKANSAYELTTGTDEPNYRLSESNVRYNAQKDLLGNWQAVDYDDALWTPAIEKGTPPSLPWGKLWLRPIPQWKNFGLTNYISLSQTLPFTTTVQTTISAKLPYNAQVTPYFEIESPAGLIIDMRTDDYSPSGGKSLRAEYVTKAGVQSYESFGWMNGQNLNYKIPAGVTVKALKYRETGYNSEFSGSFTCNDPYFNTLWRKAQRTLYITMRDNYMDCPDRERALWWGDAVIEIGEAFYALDRNSDLLAKKSISNIIEWQKPDKTMFSPIPAGNWSTELPVQTLATIGECGFWNYFKYSGDTTTIVDAYSHVKNYLSLWTMDADGLVNHRAGGWDWEDWGNNIDTRLLDNCWYYLALKGALNMAILTNNTTDTAAYNVRMRSIEKNFNRVLWKVTYYKSPAYTGVIDDRGNGLAVVAGLADSAKWSAIRNVLNNYRSASPYMEKYVLEAQYLMGYENDALTRMKLSDRYGTMVNNTSYSTLWELFTLSGGTTNHAWAGGPLTLLSQYAAGVAPESAGFKTYHVFPQEGSLKSIKSITPSIKGNIVVEIAKDTTSYSLKLSSPTGTMATIGIPKNSLLRSIQTIRINNTIVWQNGNDVGMMSGVSFAGEDSRYYKFNVESGDYIFTASCATITSLKNTPTIYETDELSIFPIPADKQITLMSTNPMTEIQLLLTDGKLFKCFKNEELSRTLDIADLKCGVYFLRVTLKNKKTVLKMFVKSNNY
jgi:alpha-L-rhamnosidase